MHEARPARCFGAGIDELAGALARPKLARVLDPELRSELLWQLDNLGVSFEPSARVTDCRDPKDNRRGHDLDPRLGDRRAGAVVPEGTFTVTGVGSAPAPSPAALPRGDLSRKAGEVDEDPGPSDPANLAGG